jgi:hypothetical protein
MPVCPLCKSAADEAFTVPGADQIRFECRRCGQYDITRRLRVNLEGPRTTDEERTLARFVGGFIQRRNAANETPLLTTDNWRRFAEGHAHTPVEEKARRLLGLLGERSAPGREAVVDRDNDAPLIDAIDGNEVWYYLRHLVDAGFISELETSDGGHTLTVAGWRQLKSGPAGIPGRCFIAMSFHPSLKTAFSEGIKPAIGDCGLEPVRVDRDEHDDKIDDRIIVEIRRAEFVVADVTMQRQGVYFEAGFAIGLAAR